MICELAVENLAIIEKAVLTFESGFTALTGETGAGKSLLVDAIELALGERADSDLVRTGSPKATVQLTADLTEAPGVRAACVEAGYAVEDDLLILSREVSAEGRSTCRINGRTAPVSVLKALGNALVDLHGQHDHQALLHPEAHLGYLDQWIGAPLQELLRPVANAHEAFAEATRRLVAFQKTNQMREQRLDLLRYQVNEITEAAPLEGESEELEAQLSRLRNAEKLVTASASALTSLSDDEAAATELIARAVSAIEAVTRFDAALEPIAESLRNVQIEAEEAASALRDYLESLEADPGALDLATERLDLLKRLRRKYGATEADVLAHLASAQEELAMLEDAEANEESLGRTVETTRAALSAACAGLTALRTDYAARFASEIQRELRDLAMAKAEFSVSILAQEPTANGADAVQFFFSANPGESPKPLAKIASGGEMSRVMLAIKSGLAGKDGVPTLIFDEVDAGLGGRAAATVARKLEELARHAQVLVISHSPQIASRANVHYRIEKVERDGRVVTEIRQLDADEREQEIARMLAGEHVTDAALANARALLAG